MKVLLTTLNSKYIHSNLALKCLFSVCTEGGYSIELKEFTTNNTEDYIFGELLRGDYDVFCFSCYIWNIELTLPLAENLKKAKPEAVIVLGGPEVSWRGPEIMKKHRAVDFILAGEGEENLPVFLERLFSGDGEPGFEDICGLHYRGEGKIFVNLPSEPADINLLPFPYSKLISEADKIMYYESTRGCPFSCSYCISAIEKGMRALSVERVKSDLSYFIYKGVKQVKFVDRTFNYDNARALEIIRYLMENDNGITNYHFELCGDIISDELLEILPAARPGLFQFEIGVQSTNPETLKSINRRCDFDLLFENVNRIREMGNIHLHLDLIAGLPHENYQSFAASFNHVYRMKPHMLQLGFLKLLPGTPIREEAEKYSYVFRSKAPYEVISNSFITAKELAKLKMVEMVFDLYYNRGGFENTLEYLSGAEGWEAFAFYENFADFYYSKGFQHKSHSKEDLYRILHSYISSLDKDKQRVMGIAELLLERDMEHCLNPEAIRKFTKIGWEMKP
ncbi:B12-binding domain-containing radical SAM protein [Bacillota bacterium]